MARHTSAGMLTKEHYAIIFSTPLPLHFLFFHPSLLSTRAPSGHPVTAWARAQLPLSSLLTSGHGRKLVVWCCGCERLSGL